MFRVERGVEPCFYNYPNKGRLLLGSFLILGSRSFFSRVFTNQHIPAEQVEYAGSMGGDVASDAVTLALRSSPVPDRCSHMFLHYQRRGVRQVRSLQYQRA
jgi:hypothetical protein